MPHRPQCEQYPCLAVRSIRSISTEFEAAVVITSSLDSERAPTVHRKSPSQKRSSRTLSARASRDPRNICLSFVENESVTPFVLEFSFRRSSAPEVVPPSVSDPHPSSEDPPPSFGWFPCLSVAFSDSRYYSSSAGSLLADLTPSSLPPVVLSPFPTSTESLQRCFDCSANGCDVRRLEECRTTPRSRKNFVGFRQHENPEQTGPHDKPTSDSSQDEYPQIPPVLSKVTDLRIRPCLCPADSVPFVNNFLTAAIPPLDFRSKRVRVAAEWSIETSSRTTPACTFLNGRLTRSILVENADLVATLVFDSKGACVVLPQESSSEESVSRTLGIIFLNVYADCLSLVEHRAIVPLALELSLCIDDQEFLVLECESRRPPVPAEHPTKASDELQDPTNSNCDIISEYLQLPNLEDFSLQSLAILEDSSSIPQSVSPSAELELRFLQGFRAVQFNSRVDFPCHFLETIDCSSYSEDKASRVFRQQAIAFVSLKDERFQQSSVPPSASQLSHHPHHLEEKRIRISNLIHDSFLEKVLDRKMKPQDLKPSAIPRKSRRMFFPHLAIEPMTSRT
jgi:hypothetical protein